MPGVVFVGSREGAIGKLFSLGRRVRVAVLQSGMQLIEECVYGVSQ